MGFEINNSKEKKCILTEEDFFYDLDFDISEDYGNIFCDTITS